MVSSKDERMLKEEVGEVRVGEEEIKASFVLGLECFRVVCE